MADIIVAILQAAVVIFSLIALIEGALMLALLLLGVRVIELKRDSAFLISVALILFGTFMIQAII
jgi:hypothetical protein